MNNSSKNPAAKRIYDLETEVKAQRAVAKARAIRIVDLEEEVARLCADAELYDNAAVALSEACQATSELRAQVAERDETIAELEGRERAHHRTLSAQQKQHAAEMEAKSTRIAELEAEVARLKVETVAVEAHCKTVQAIHSDLRYERERLRLADQTSANLRAEVARLRATPSARLVEAARKLLQATRDNPNREDWGGDTESAADALESALAEVAPWPAEKDLPDAPGWWAWCVDPAQRDWNLAYVECDDYGLKFDHRKPNPGVLLSAVKQAFPSSVWYGPIDLPLVSRETR